MNEPGQIVEGVVVTLSGVGSAVFTVLDPAGNPVTGLNVALNNRCEAACGCTPKATGPDGTVQFDNLPLGQVYARALRSTAGFTDVSSATASITRDGAVATATLRFLGFGTVTGTVREADGDLAHGAYVDLESRVFDAEWCDLIGNRSHSVRTNTDGTFRFTGVAVGGVRATASHPFFPTPVGAERTLTQNGQQVDIPLTLVSGTSTIAGELSGTVFLPDGSTPAGAGVEVTMNGALPDVTVTTNDQGRYRFAKIFPAGSYTMTVRDPVSGGLAQETLFLVAAQDTTHNIRLKGRGTVRVRVVDGADHPVQTAFVRLRETGFPGGVFEGVLDASNLGVVTFPGVFEGPVSAEVSDALARGGRAASTLPKPGDTIEIKVVVSTTGRVVGHFLMPDGTPIPFAAISLVAGGRTIGQITTTGSGDVGAFAFDYVPAGPVQITAQDPATARTGIAGGTIETEGQLLTLDVRAQALGTVGGLVTSNGAPQPGANVVILVGRFQHAVDVRLDRSLPDHRRAGRTRRRHSELWRRLPRRYGIGDAAR